jgi:cysteine synthase A
LIEAAEKDGHIGEGTTILNPQAETLVWPCFYLRCKGIQTILTMPDTMSIEAKALEIFGADVVLTDGAKGMSGALAKAEELHREIKTSLFHSSLIILQSRDHKKPLHWRSE